MTEPIPEVRWGLIGTGDVAETKGGPALYNVPYSRLLAVTNRNRPKAEAFARRHGADRVHDSIEAMLADDEIDAVYIATPPHVHAEMTRRAAEAGKHVLCEKPMASTVAECEQMIADCKHHGVQLIIAYYRRFWPIARKIKTLLDERAIGQIVRARAHLATFYRPRNDGERTWLTDPSTAGGGFMTDAGTHRLDLFAFFFGAVKSLVAYTDTLTFDFREDVDDTSTVLMRFENGVHVTGAFNWNSGVNIDEFEICGTEGRIFSRDLGAGQLETTVAGRKESHFLPPTDITHQGLVEHFVDCLRTGTPNALPGEAGIQATRMTEAAYASSRTRNVFTP